MTLGQKIKSARLARGMTQKELVGDAITRNMLSKIENDAATPSVRTLDYLAHALDLPVSYLLGDSGCQTAPCPTDWTRPAPLTGRAAGWTVWPRWRPTKQPGSTDEGYLLHARAGLLAAAEPGTQGLCRRPGAGRRPLCTITRRACTILPPWTRGCA